MRILIVFLLALCLLETATGQTIKEGKPRLLHGFPQTVRIEVAKMSNQSGTWVEGKRVLLATYTFDTKGNLLKSIINNADGSAYVKYTAVYDTQSNKIEETYSTPKDIIIDKMVYHYDANNRLTEKVIEKSKSSSSPSTITIIYDSGGRIIEKNRPAAKDKSGYKVKYLYDEAARRLEQQQYDQTDKLISVTVQRYDANNNLLAESYESKIQPENWQFTQSHDANGNVTEETVQLLNGSNQFRYQYEVDAMNNWIKKTTSSLVNRNGTMTFEPVEVTYRTITYYPASQATQRNEAVPLSAMVADNETKSLLQGEALKRFEPNYPADARQQRQAGMVKVLILMDEKGELLSANPLPGMPDSLRKASTTTVWNWKFAPTLRGGEPTRVISNVTFTFRL